MQTTLNPQDPSTPDPSPKRPRMEAEEDVISALRAEMAALRTELLDLKQLVHTQQLEIAALKQPRPSYRDTAAPASARAASSPASTPVAPSEQPWEQPKTKQKKKKATSKDPSPKASSPGPLPQAFASSKKTPVPSSKAIRGSLKDSLAGLSSSEKLQFLLRKPKTDAEKTQFVEILPLQLPLSTKALTQPMTAWRQTLQEILGQEPLLISLINPCRGEVYLDMKDSSRAKTLLEPYLLEPQPPGSSDLGRRAQAYLRGYFLPLRRAALAGFDPPDQLEILQRAESSLTVSKFPEESARKRLKFQIQKDREWVESTMTE